MNGITFNQRKILEKLVKILTENNIEFQLTGGMAALYYGARRPQFDIDIDVYKKDQKKIREIFRPYITEDWNNNLEPNDPFDVWILKLNIEGVLVDMSQVEDSFVVSPAGERQQLPAVMHPATILFEGIRIPIVPKDELIAYKKIVGRGIDLQDIEEIEKHPKQFKDRVY